MKEPAIAAGAILFPGAQVVGDVTLAPGVSVWYNAVLRGDEAPITVGRDSNIQDGCILHRWATAVFSTAAPLGTTPWWGWEASF